MQVRMHVRKSNASKNICPARLRVTCPSNRERYRICMCVRTPPPMCVCVWQIGQRELAALTVRVSGSTEAASGFLRCTHLATLKYMGSACPPHPRPSQPTNQLTTHVPACSLVTPSWLISLPLPQLGTWLVELSDRLTSPSTAKFMQVRWHLGRIGEVNSMMYGNWEIVLFIPTWLNVIWYKKSLIWQWMDWTIHLLK